jgi:hypothetical protein
MEMPSGYSEWVTARMGIECTGGDPGIVVVAKVADGSCKTEWSSMKECRPCKSDCGPGYGCNCRWDIGGASSEESLIELLSSGSSGANGAGGDS